MGVLRTISKFWGTVLFCCGTASILFTIFSRGKTVIAGLEFNDKGITIVILFLLSVSGGLLFLAFSPVLIALYDSRKPKARRFRDMHNYISEVRTSLISDVSVGIPSGVNAHLTTLVARLNSLCIPNPGIPMDYPDHIAWSELKHYWQYFLGELVVYSREGSYKEAKELNREVYEYLGVDQIF